MILTGWDHSNARFGCTGILGKKARPYPLLPGVSLEVSEAVLLFLEALKDCDVAAVGIPVSNQREPSILHESRVDPVSMGRESGVISVRAVELAGGLRV